MIGDKNRDYYAGAVVAFIGAGAAVVAFRYNIGTLTKMGPGFFPFSLGLLLVFLGALIAGSNFLDSGEHAAPNPMLNLHGAMKSAPDWRGWGCIIGAVLTFIFMADFAGLLAAVLFCVFIACWGDKTANLQDSSTLALGIVVFGILLFSDILRVQLPAFKDGPAATATLLLGLALFCFIAYTQWTSLRDLLLAALVTPLGLAIAVAVLLVFPYVVLLASVIVSLVSALVSLFLHSAVLPWLLPVIPMPGAQDLMLGAGIGVFGIRIFAYLLRARLPTMPDKPLAQSVSVYGAVLLSFILLAQLHLFRGM